MIPKKRIENSMRLYPKRLQNIKDLEQEKKRLLKQVRILDEEDILSFKKPEEKTGKSEKSGSILDLMQGGNPIVSALLALAQKKLLAKDDSGKKPQKKSIQADPVEKKNILLPIAKEFIGGYLKWKAIELSYKGIKIIVKKRKQRKEAEQQLPS